MYKYILSILLLIFSISNTQSQQNSEAKQLVMNLIHSLQQNAMRSNFNLTISEKNNLNLQTISGVVIIKGKQFYLETDDVQVWFDGKTQWAYLQNSDEVTITEPTSEELVTTNPITMLDDFITAGDFRFENKKNMETHFIKFVPKKSQMEIEKMEIRLLKSSDQLSGINIQLKNGTTNELTFSNYKQNYVTDSSTFTFDVSKHKGVVLNDLR